MSITGKQRSYTHFLEEFHKVQLFVVVLTCSLQERHNLATADEKRQQNGLWWAYRIITMMKTHEQIAEVKTHV